MPRQWPYSRNTDAPGYTANPAPPPAARRAVLPENQQTDREGFADRGCELPPGLVSWSAVPVGIRCPPLSILPYPSASGVRRPGRRCSDGQQPSYHKEYHAHLLVSSVESQICITFGSSAKLTVLHNKPCTGTPGLISVATRSRWPGVLDSDPSTQSLV